MTNRIPDYLKLHVEDTTETSPTATLAEFARLRTSFSAATGRRLVIDESTAGQQLTFPWTETSAPQYRVSLEPTNALLSPTKPTPQDAEELAAALAQLLNDLSRVRHALRHLIAAGGAIGVAHAGWRGIVGGIVGSTIRVMTGELGVRHGDLLVASPNPGHVMRAVAPLPGTVVGKAGESLETGIGTIEVLLMLR